MTSIKITRRQFLKWMSASAAALGLTQTDLLKVEKALAAGPTPDPNFPVPPLARVIWIAGAACSGCPTSLLNYIADTADPDPVLGAIANNALSLWFDIETLYPVNFPPPGAGDGDIDIAEVVLEIITIDYTQIVGAASGDTLNNYLLSLMADPDYKYVLLVEGSIQTAANGKYCRVMDVPGDLTATAGWPTAATPYVTVYTTTDNTNGVPAGQKRTDVTMAGATLWLGCNDNCLAVVAFGTCAAYGGVPAAKKGVTGAMGAYEWLNCVNDCGKLVLNIPGCPPNSDWVIASVGAALLELNGVIPGILFNNLDATPALCVTGVTVPRNTYIGANPNAEIFHKDHGYVFCMTDPRNGQGSAPTLLLCQRSASQPIGKCMKQKGCNGWLAGPPHIKPDCPTRMWNPIESPCSGSPGLLKNNWCVLNNSPCNGCASPGFPDYCSPFYEQTKEIWRGYPYTRPLKSC